MLAQQKAGGDFHHLHPYRFRIHQTIEPWRERKGRFAPSVNPLHSHQNRMVLDPCEAATEGRGKSSITAKFDAKMRDVASCNYMKDNDNFGFQVRAPLPPIDVEERSRQLRQLERQMNFDFSYDGQMAYFKARDELIASWNIRESENPLDVYFRQHPSYGEKIVPPSAQEDQETGYAIPVGFRLDR